MQRACSGIYAIVNISTGERYIGSSANIRSRWRHHRHLLECGTHHSKHLQNSWNKHGAAAFAFRVLFICDRDHLIDYEQSALDSLRPRYNASPKAGLPHGVPISPEGRQRLSRRMQGNTIWAGRKHSPETLERMALAHQGNTRTKGKPRNPEAVQRTAAAHRGMKRSPETCARISAATAGKKRGPRSAQWCANISAAQKGRRPSPESIEKMRLTKRGSRLSPEHRAAIGVASKIAWARRKAGV